MDLIELSCTVCLEVYSEGQNAPVMLPNCGHTFCRSCLSNLQATCINCPTCRLPHRGLDVNKLPVNFAQLTLVDKLKNVQDKEVSKCYIHGQPLNLWCSEEQKQMCAMCFFTEMKHTQTRVLSVSELQTQLDTLGDTIRKKASVLSQVYLALKHALSADSQSLENIYTRKLETHMRKNGTDVIPPFSQMELQALVEELSYEEKKVILDDGRLEEYTNEEYTDEENAYGDDTDDGNAYILSLPEEYTDGEGECEGNPSTCESLLRCVAVDSGERKAKLTWEDGVLHVYAPESMHPDWSRASLVVQMEDVRHLIYQEEPTVFLDLADEDATPLGRVVIRLWGRLRRAQQFLALCDGRLGPTFKGSNFVEVDIKNHCRALVGGQYQRPNGKMSYAGLMEDLEWGRKYQRKGQRTLVAAWSYRGRALETKFGISLADTSFTLHCPFGEVVSGMSVVDAAADRIPVTKVKIAEVGVVIPEFVTED